MSPPKPKQPARKPAEGSASQAPEPKGPRTPYPVDEPPDPHGRGSEPDYFPGKPAGGELAEDVRRAYSFNFRFRWPSVRSRSALSRIKPSASRWS